MKIKVVKAPAKAVPKSATAQKMVKIGRDAETGRIITVKEAQSRPKTATVETVKKPAPTPSARAPQTLTRDAGTGRITKPSERDSC